MNTRILVPVVGALLLGGAALALADDGWRHDERQEHGHFRSYADHGWRHVTPAHWRGPGYYAPPPAFGPRWCPPRHFEPWGPRHYQHGSAWVPAYGRDGVTVILRGSFN
jgi:hypothetical protein